MGGVKGGIVAPRNFIYANKPFGAYGSPCACTINGLMSSVAGVLALMIAVHGAVRGHTTAERASNHCARCVRGAR